MLSCTLSSDVTVNDRDRDGGNESVDDSDCGNVAQENDDDNDEDDANDRNFRVGSFGSGYMIQ